MTPKIYSKFLNFLQQELAISKDYIAMAEKNVEKNSNLLPMVLWQYGMVTIEQLDRIYDWMESV